MTPPSEQTDTVTAPEPSVVSLPVTPDPPKETATPPAPGPARRTMRRIWTTFKVLVLIAAIAGIAAAVYYGWPEVSDRLRGIDSNSAGVSAVNDRIDASNVMIADLEAQLATLADAEAATPERFAALETLAAELADGQAELTEQLAAIESQISDHDDRLIALAAAQATLATDASATSVDVANQIGVVRAMELLSRARLFLYQANYGLAEQDVRAARNVLAGMQDQVGDAQAEVTVATLARLDLVLRALPSRPVAAAGDLDIAWQLLLGEVPNAVATTAEDAPASDDETGTTDTTTVP